MKKGKENRGAPSTDLLVCFPSRAHLTLTMPKPICSPARHSSDHSTKRHLHYPHPHHLKKSITRGIRNRGGGGGAGGGHGSPLLWAAASAKSNKQLNIGGGGGSSTEMEEPTSPKVTCAGQIKIRPQSSACRNWQSVMEEIEKIHNDRRKLTMNKKRRPGWTESFGFKKDIMNFLACLRSVRLDLRCFGSFPEPPEISSDDDEDQEDQEEEPEEDELEVLDDDIYRYHGNSRRPAGSSCKVDGDNVADDASKTIFSKWFMVLQEENHNDIINTNAAGGRPCESKDNYNGGSSDVRDHQVPSDHVDAPPPNALLLMRCRSAPTAAKGWQLEDIIGGRDRIRIMKDAQEEEEQKELVGLVQEKVKQLVVAEDRDDQDRDENKKKMRKSLAIVMKYDTDFYDLSSDIAKETWVPAGCGFTDPLSRSRSWRR